MSKKISIAYSPDTDDAFMVYALKSGLISKGGYEFEFFKDDIQTLNQAAIQGKYDVCAISMAAYPKIKEDYLLMPIGASVGDEFGPAILTSADSEIVSLEDLKGKRVAVPGMETTAFFAAFDLFGPFDPVPMAFDTIESAIESQSVDGGILIHEPQLVQNNENMRKLGDLGKLWYEKYKLPLPLGGNAIRRGLGSEAIQKITEIYKNSICYGLEHREETIKEASSSAVVQLEYELADQYIDQYVNHRSIDLQDDVIQGIQKIFEVGAKNRLCRQVDDQKFYYRG